VSNRCSHGTFFHFSLQAGGTKADDIYTGFVRDIAKYGLDVANCVMVVTDTAANMKKFGKQLEEKLHLDHGFCIDHVFQLTKKSAFKSTNSQKRKANGNNLPKSDEINALRKAREFTTVLNHSTQNLLERMLRLKEPIKKLLYNEIFDNTQNDTSILHKCHMNKDNWKCLADIKHVIQPFKEGQAICEGQKFVTIPRPNIRQDNQTGTWRNKRGLGARGPSITIRR
jgi:hypothetical protein